MWAAENGHADSSRLLLDSGADVMVKDSVSLPPCPWHTQSMELLPTARAGPQRRSLGVVGLEASLGSRSRIVEGCDCHHASLMCKHWRDASSQAGSTALIRAVVQGHVNSARMLLECGADVDAKDDVSPLSRQQGRRALGILSHRQARSLLQSQFELMSPYRLPALAESPGYAVLEFRVLGSPAACCWQACSRLSLAAP